VGNDGGGVSVAVRAGGGVGSRRLGELSLRSSAGNAGVSRPLLATRKPGPVEVLGHRGWPAPSHPENTVAAVRAALDAGACGVEVDVRLTADHQPVCLHDADLLRVAGRRDRIRGMLSAAVAQVRLPGGHAVPRLTELAASVAGRGLLILDVKPDRRSELVARQVVGALADGFPPDDVVVSSAQRSILRAVRRRAPWLRRALISVPGNPAAPLLTAAINDGIGGIHLDVPAFLDDLSFVAEAHRHKVMVRCWTVNREADAVLADIAGADGVISDHPAAMRGVVARSGRPATRS
jgi:glycerophosphoryl diester phosphodiesterase